MVTVVLLSFTNNENVILKLVKIKNCSWGISNSALKKHMHSSISTSEASENVFHFVFVLAYDSFVCWTAGVNYFYLPKIIVVHGISPSSNSKEVPSYLPWQYKYPNFKITFISNQNFSCKLNFLTTYSSQNILHLFLRQ